MGLKNIFLFSKSLDAKATWRLVKTDILQTFVITHKYLSLYSLEEWIRNPMKNRGSFSVIWKVILKYFHVLGDGLAWSIENGTKVRI
jgi:hypothetical protein